MKQRQHTVFISYSWDSSPHKAWVRKLAERLEKEPDVKVVLDQLDTWAGMDLSQFMEIGLQADRILMVLTPTYARKASARRGGVGYENSIITGQLLRRTHRDRFIPVLRGDAATSFPSYLYTRLAVDMRDPGSFEAGVADLLRAIRRQNARIVHRPKSHARRKTRGFGFPSWLAVPPLNGYHLYLRQYAAQFDRESAQIGSDDDTFWFPYEHSLGNWPFTWGLVEKKLTPDLIGIEIGLDSTSRREPATLPAMRFEVLVQPARALPVVDAVTFRELADDGWRLTALRTDEVRKHFSLPVLFGPQKGDPRFPLIRFAITSAVNAPIRKEANKIIIYATLHFEGGAGLSEQWRI